MTTPAASDPVISQIVAFLRGGHAHATLEDAISDFPSHLRGSVPAGLPYSAWQLLEHLRIAQRDILDFSSPPPSGYKSLEWPKDYWPANSAPPTSESWDQTIAAIHADRDSFVALLTAPDVNLYDPFRWGNGQNLLREALLIIDHNGYHTGELVLLRRLLGVWKS